LLFGKALMAGGDNQPISQFQYGFAVPAAHHLLISMDAVCSQNSINSFAAELGAIEVSTRLALWDSGM
jgi:hypothetical protein